MFCRRSNGRTSPIKFENRPGWGAFFLLLISRIRTSLKVRTRFILLVRILPRERWTAPPIRWLQSHRPSARKKFDVCLGRVCLYFEGSNERAGRPGDPACPLFPQSAEQPRQIHAEIRSLRASRDESLVQRRNT